MAAGKITFKQYKRAYAELQDRIEQKIGNEWFPRIQISEDIRISDDAEIGFKINWSAIGAVSVEDAVEFANKIKIAAREIELFPYNGYSIDYEL